MTDTAQTEIWTPGRKTAAVAILALWFAAAAAIGVSGVLTNDGLSLLPPVALGVAVPVALFLGTYAASAGFRRFVLTQDVETLTMLQHWRVIGFAFLPLYFVDALPGLFALPAGLGDVAIGLAAPFIVLRMRRDPAFATSAGLARYHYLGLLDFAVAFVTVGLAAGAFPALTPGGVTSAAMDVWPLNLFPTFGVPIFIILHLAVLLKLRALKRRSALPAGAAAAT